MIDALLGAAALGTIGEHFPDTDARLAGVSSLMLLDETLRLLGEAGYRVINVDSVITAQEPRLQPHLGKMARTLAARLGVASSCVGVKATSPEALGALGPREGGAAQAVALQEASLRRCHCPTPRPPARPSSARWRRGWSACTPVDPRSGITRTSATTAPISSTTCCEGTWQSAATASCTS